MLKRWLTILLLLIPTAVPAASGACLLMQEHFSAHQAAVDDCCLIENAAHCPMTAKNKMDNVLPQTASPQTEICTCPDGNSTIPPAVSATAPSQPKNEANPRASQFAALWQNPRQSENTAYFRLPGDSSFKAQPACLRI